MKQPQVQAMAGLRQRLQPLAVLTLLLLAGCTSPQGGMGFGPAKVATLSAQVPSTVQTAGNREIACQIQMIDGAMVASSDRLQPGHHRLIVALGPQEGEFSGDVDLVIPAARDYRLKAEREDDTFTVSLIEVGTAQPVATSSAAAAPLMRFQVFVIQK